MFPPPSLFDEASALTTRINTRTGATALRAPTKSEPSIVSTVRFGRATPRIAPITSPVTILLIRLISFHFLNNSFILPFILSAKK